MIEFKEFRFDLLEKACEDSFSFAVEPERIKKHITEMRNVWWDLAKILETINNGLIVLSTNGRILMVNTVFEEITGCRAVECLGIDVRDFSGLPKVFVKEVLAKKGSAVFITELKGRAYLVKCNPVVNEDNEPVSYVCTFEDIEKVGQLMNSLTPAKPQIPKPDRIDRQPVGEDIIINSRVMRNVVEVGLRVARVDTTVLISGETGVGKEVMARIIHQNSPRKDKPFIRINCGAIPAELLESELFGYEQGAFTGAGKNGKQGLIEMADGGTLFLDEVGELPLNLQVKLLRVLQEHEIQKIGSTGTKRVDFRLIAATKRYLKTMVIQQKFREDLYYRLSVVPIVIPPLRHRKEDVIPLTEFFLNRFNMKYGFSKRISPGVQDTFLWYDWPGNVRELRNIIERLMVTSESDIISAEDVVANTEIKDVSPEEDEVLSLANVLQKTEKKLICEAFKTCKNTREMAEVLGISQSAVVKKMKKYGISKVSNG